MDISDTAGEEFLENAAFIDKYWMYLSLFLGVLTVYCLNDPKFFKNSSPIVKYGYFLSALYSLHQFEEHGYDILGRRYMFVPTFNAIAENTVGLKTNLTPRATTYINMFFVWCVNPLNVYFLSTEKNCHFPAAYCWGAAVINGMSHLLQVTQGIYLPGAVQSLFMVPLGIYFLFVEYKKFVHPVFAIIGGIIFHLFGLIVPCIMFPGIDEIHIPAQILVAIIFPKIFGSLLYNINNKHESGEKQL